MSVGSRTGKKRGQDDSGRSGSIWKGKWAESVAICLCLLLLGLFVSCKEGFHMDELLSFELANARFNPWIVTTQPEGRLAKFVRNEIDGETFGETIGNLVETVKDVIENRGASKLLTYQADVYEEPVWITAEQFKDYITVDKKDAFQYLSVYFNVKDDNHPPLHFMVLHTISSLFRGQAKPWMGCVINLAAMAAVMALLMGLGRMLAEAGGCREEGRKRMIGLCCGLLYGLSCGAVATTLLIRMYGLLTLWCVAYFYLILQKWRDRAFDRHNIRLVLVTLLGFWTQYFFLFYCILLAGTVCVLLFREKRMGELLRFVRSMAIAAVVGVAVFPFAIQDVFSSGRGVEALQNLGTGFAGYGERLAAFLGILEERTFGVPFWALLCILAVLVLAGRGQKKLDFQREKKAVREPGPSSGKGAYIWMLVLPGAGYFLLAARMSPYLVDRYMMPVFPFVILWGVLLLYGLLSALEGRYPSLRCRKIHAVIFLAVVLLQVWGLWQYDGSYLYRGYALQSGIARPDYSCICIYDGVGYYENLPEFTVYERSLLLTFGQLENRKDRESIRELDKVAVLVKPGNGYDDLQVLELLEEEYGFRLESMGMREKGPHGDMIYFMRKDM